MIRPETDWQNFLDSGQFMILRSRSTSEYVFFPRVAVPGSGATDLEWVKASGKGVVYASTVVRNRPPEADYNVALVDLAEGPRMMSRIVGLAPDAVRIGMKVEAEIISENGHGLVVFRPQAQP